MISNNLSIVSYHGTMWHLFYALKILCMALIKQRENHKMIRNWRKRRTLHS